jgi:hypothetical protein
MLGFSVRQSNDFSARLEEQSVVLESSFRLAYVRMMEGMNALHDAVDAALDADAHASSAPLEAGLAKLGAANDQLTALGETFVRLRTELFEQADVDPADPLVARERYFAAVDYEGAYRELLAHGAALPHHLYWTDLVDRLRDGGARAGFRLLDRHLRELQSDLRTFVGEVESLRGLPLADLAATLHGSSRPVATIIVGFTRLLISFTYFAMLCERASQLYEISSGEVGAAVAVAS